MKVISGGQTGVERIGLMAAWRSGFQTGGTAPREFMTEYGPDPSLRKFGLKEHSSRAYNPRTIQNVLDSDGTVLFGNMESTGRANTREYCIHYHKPYLENPTSQQLVEFVKAKAINVLNVAGNRRSKLSNSQVVSIFRGLLSVFRQLNSPSTLR